MNFNELNEKVKSVQLGVARITDVKAGEHTLEIVTSDNAEPQILLVNAASGKKHRITVAGLAAMRTVADKKALKNIVSTVDARENEEIKNLQAALAQDKSSITPTTKFTVAGTLQILDVESGENVYRNDAYAGYGAYLKATRKIVAQYPDPCAERTQAFTEAGETLRGSGVKKDCKGKEEFYLTMPVFIVS